MKLRELYQESALSRFLVINRILDLFALYHIASPVIKTRENIKSIQSQYDQQSPRMSESKKNKLIEHELATCAGQIAGLLVGNSVLKNLGRTFINVFGTGWFTKELSDLMLAYGQVRFMQWVDSNEGRETVADWLTGQAFHALGVIGESGPLFDKYIGHGLKTKIENAEQSLKSIVSNKVSNYTGVGSNLPKKPIQVTHPKPGIDVEYDPNDMDNPYRVNVKRNF